MFLLIEQWKKPAQLVNLDKVETVWVGSGNRVYLDRANGESTVLLVRDGEGRAAFDAIVEAIQGGLGRVDLARLQKDLTPVINQEVKA